MSYISEIKISFCGILIFLMKNGENFWLETIRSFLCYWTLWARYAMIANGVTNL